MCLAARLQTSPVLHSAWCLPSPPTSQDENAEQGFFIGCSMKEIWKPVKGFIGRYEVSSEGRVRSLPQVIICEGPVKGRYTSVRQGKLLRPGRMPGGHLSVALGKGNSQCVHKLVLNAFVGPAPDDYECLHINGNPADNRLQNLRWGTRSENNRDKVRLGEQYKLSIEDVKKIKRALRNPYRGINTDLAHKFGVSHITISGIRHGRQHGWVLVD